MTGRLSDADECTLIRQALDQDQSAFGELVIRYEKSLYNVVFGVVGDAELARDVTQETFLRANQFLARYRKSFKFSTWLFRIGVNLGISKLRRSRLECDVFSEHGIAHHGLLRRTDRDTPLDCMLREERANDVLAAIKDLSERYRTVLMMRYKDGLSCREIGAEFGISANSVSIILHRSKTKLREFLRVDEKEEEQEG